MDKKPNTTKQGVDYVALLKAYWHGRHIILISSLVFAVIGVFAAYSAQEEFVSQVKLMPESEQGQNLGGLGGLVRQFGVNTNIQTSEGIPASLYPDVAKNLVMMKQLMAFEITLSETGESMTLKEYFLQPSQRSVFSTIKKYTIGLPAMILNWVRSLVPKQERQNQVRGISNGDEEGEIIIQNFTDAEWIIIENLRGRIDVTQDIDTGIIIVQVTMPDPVLAAEIANQVVQFLTEYITNYRTEKTRKDLEFIEDRLDDAKAQFVTAQTALASYTDRQRATTRATDDVERQRLENEFSVAFNVYNIMAQRLEDTKIRLQEVTPVVSILDPPAIPNKRSAPQRMRILAVYLLMGVIVGGLYINVKQRIQTYVS